MQYSCNYPNLSPPGCTQWLFGGDTGVVRNFNFMGGAGQHLADQNQVICFRREGRNCR